VFAPGTALSAGHLGVLAGLGVLEPLVHRRPRIGVV
jgi:molybdopterin biosynthesis enzyme